MNFDITFILSKQCGKANTKKNKALCFTVNLTPNSGRDCTEVLL
jgi:hypothetical protein